MKKIIMTFIGVIVAVMLFFTPVLANDQSEFTENFDYAAEMKDLDIGHALHLIKIYMYENPYATEEQINLHLIYLIKSNSIFPERARVDWAGFLPSNVNHMGPHTTAVFNSNPISGMQALNSGRIAEDTAASRWSAASLHNGNGDAFRHAFWNAHLFFQIANRDFVIRFTTAWEDDGDARGQPRIERDMDIFNNLRGVEIGTSFRNANIGVNPNVAMPRLEAEVMNATRNGVLRIISNGRLVASNGNGSR